VIYSRSLFKMYSLSFDNVAYESVVQGQSRVTLQLRTI